MKIKANPGPKSWRGGSFRPSGRISSHGRSENPRTWSTTETLAARIFVGFKVGNRVKWRIGDLEGIVEEARTRQTGNPNSSFVSQRGIYKSLKSGKVVEEPGAQVILIDEQGVSVREFTEQMERLAELIAVQLQQESVVVEVQKNGMTVETFGVSA
jgi:hypothetical protein